MNAPIITTLKAVAAETNALAAEGVQRVDARATNSATQRRDYVARVTIYPKLVHGRFRLLKWVGMAVMLGIYYVLPWLRWDRGAHAPNQAVLVDLARERFYFFWIEIWPQEVYYVTGLLILAALLLFFVTSLFGRVWCGYACPQTVWTDLFIFVERLIEGDRNERIRLDKSPWSIDKLGRKAAKHVAWLLIAAATGGAWIFYFHNAPTLAVNLLQGTADPTAYLFLGILTFTTYWLAGHMREQVCTYMCPWPRIQAALVDRETLMVTYRTDRGEPRGAHKKGQPWEGRGHCIDCNQCVAACPMGIDIREGDQLECINCALCIDACNSVMKRVGLPRGLIAYDTPQNIERRTRGEKAGFHFVRPRVVVYALALAAVAAVMLFGLSTRATIDLNVLRDRNPTFVRLSDGAVRNAYTVKVMNRGAERRTFRLAIEGPAGFEVKVIGVEGVSLPISIDVEPDRLRTLRVLLTVPARSLVAASMPVVFDVGDGKETRSNATVFLSDGDGR
ncbi:MAG: cytochrome c oxidase accessory protein CcoG [Alphaproteobacteria bacterium]|nr:cytochrome c oxidase accessory protein CcoG [Alphaproteobacteria bacterium]